MLPLKIQYGGDPVPTMREMEEITKKVRDAEVKLARTYPHAVKLDMDKLAREGEQEVCAWLDSQPKHRFVFGPNLWVTRLHNQVIGLGAVYFEDGQDAMLFKLTFGGA